MPTARELLEQADALMRRNRARELDADIPELTDEVAFAASGAPVREHLMGSRSTPRQRQGPGDDVPELNDAVGELSIPPLPDGEGEVSRWLEVDRGEASITGPAPDSIVAVPPSSPPAESPPASDPVFEAMHGTPPVQAAEPAFDEQFPEVHADPSPAAPASRPDESPMPAAETALPAAPDERQWEGLAEEIRMQVLQRIDIFTDTGLQGELAARLQPIVDRASADLVTTINREVGQILRAYVAEAIEREIETWRESNP